MAKNIGKKFVQRFLGFLGYYPWRISPPIDLRKGSNDFREYFYFTNTQSILIDVPTVLGRGAGHLSCYSLTVNHPFVVALRASLLADNQLNPIEEVIEEYATLVQPLSALEVFGLSEQNAPLLVIQDPLAGNIHPWSPPVNGDPSAIIRYIENKKAAHLAENLQLGLSTATATTGILGFGPTSREVAQVKAKKLYNLMTSIRQEGYRRHDGIGGDIDAMILCSGDNWRWIVYEGQHRAAVLAALGENRIPVRICGVVNRDDVDLWYNVRSGIFSKVGALKVFDRIFDATPPPQANRWVEFAYSNSLYRIQLNRGTT